MVNKPNIIFLDANFLMVPIQLSIDIYSEFQKILPLPQILVVIKPIFDELEKKASLRKNKSAFKRTVHLARQLLDRREYLIYNIERPEQITVDDLLIRVINEWKRGNLDPKDLGMATNGTSLFKMHIPRNLHPNTIAPSTDRDTVQENSQNRKDSDQNFTGSNEISIDIIDLLGRDDIENRIYLATNDRELRTKARKNRIRTIYVRNYATLEIE